MVAKQQAHAEDSAQHARGMNRVWPAPTLSFPEHHDWACKVWRRMDRDLSGSITRGELDCEEFRSIIRSVMAPAAGGDAMGGASYARAEMNMTQAINYCLRKADLNSDATLSFDEFKAFTWSLRTDHPTKGTANMVFALFDLDQDGWISEREFREVWRFYMGHKPTEAEFQEEWGRLECHGSGRVTREDYIRWLQTSANPLFRRHAPARPPSTPAEGRGMQTEIHGAEEEPSDQPPLQLPSSPSPGRLPGLGKSASSQRRPQWNTRLNLASAGVQCHTSLRLYFSRPQSLPELARHYESHRGFAAQHDRLQNHQEPRKKKLLSTDTGQELLPERALPGGWMRSRSTGRRQLWEDHWQPPKCMKRRERSGLMSLRVSEPPPRWLLEYKADDAVLPQQPRVAEGA